MEITGEIYQKFDTKQVSDSFRKREFVVEYADNPMYPQLVTFQLVQDNCEKLDPFQLGQEIKVSFNIRGREWTNPQGEKKYFNSLDAWRISPVQGGGGANTPGNFANPANHMEVPEAVPVVAEEGDNDGLPF